MNTIDLIAGGCTTEQATRIIESDADRAKHVADIAAYRAHARTQYPYSGYSEECWNEKGIGCDGDCFCTCHGNNAPNFLTYAEVEEYHTEPVLP